MNTNDLYTNFVLHTYKNPPALVIEYGKGSYVWDVDGNRYLDFASGIATNTLGHCNRRFTRRVSRQLRTLIHTSNAFGHQNQGFLAKKLVDYAGPGKVFFCNSGAEANEGLIKFARLFGKLKNGKAGKPAYKIVCAQNAFHGRTMGGLSATPKPKVQDGFDPLLPGFVFAEYNNLDAFREAIDDETAAVFIETIQGEGGIHSAKPEFLQGLRALCTEKNVLLLLDEVQCGIGRTGTFFAFEQADIKPDGIGMAKGLGSGFPIGAFWVEDSFTHLFHTGSHGSTFGGGPLACAAGLATIEALEDLDLINKSRLRGRRFFKKLHRMWGYHPEIVKEVRGRGYLLGIELKVPAPDMVAALRSKGLLVMPAGTDVIRILPPLNVRAKELKAAFSILDETFTEFATNMKAGN